MADISVEYLVRIEQGSDRNPSVPVVNALAGSPAQPRLDVRPAVRKLLDQLEPGIALVTNRLGDVLAALTWSPGPRGCSIPISPT